LRREEILKTLDDFGLRSLEKRSGKLLREAVETSAKGPVAS